MVRGNAHLAGRSPGERVGVDPEEPARGGVVGQVQHVIAADLHHPHHDRGGIVETAEGGAGLPQRFLGPLPLRVVPGDDHHGIEAAIIAPHWGDGVFVMVVRARLVREGDFVALRLAGVKSPLSLGIEPLHDVGGQSQLLPPLAGHLPRLHTQHPRPAQAHIAVAALLVEQVDVVHGRRQDRRQALGLTTQLLGQLALRRHVRGGPVQAHGSPAVGVPDGDGQVCLPLDRAITAKAPDLTRSVWPASSRSMVLPTSG